MRKILVVGIICLVISGCSHTGEIDKNKIPGETVYRLNTGQEVTLPLQYANWKGIIATYAVPKEQIEHMLPLKLKPVLVFPGKAMVSFGVLQYPKVNGLQPYDEWFVSIPVQYDPLVNIPFLPLLLNPMFPYEVYKKGGSFIYYLPVTTEASRQAGSEIWGFPKVLRQITCTEDARTKKCDLMNGDEVEMSLEIEKIAVNGDKREFAFCAYTEKDNQFLRTCILAEGNYDYTVFGRGSITFGHGKIAEEMGKFDIDHENPLQIFYAENLTSALPLEYERLEK